MQYSQAANPSRGSVSMKSKSASSACLLTKALIMLRFCTRGCSSWPSATGCASRALGRTGSAALATPAQTPPRSAAGAAAPAGPALPRSQRRGLLRRRPAGPGPAGTAPPSWRSADHPAASRWPGRHVQGQALLGVQGLRGGNVHRSCALCFPARRSLALQFQQRSEHQTLDGRLDPLHLLHKVPDFVGVVGAQEVPGFLFCVDVVHGHDDVHGPSLGRAGALRGVEHAADPRARLVEVPGIQHVKEPHGGVFRVQIVVPKALLAGPLPFGLRMCPQLNPCPAMLSAKARRLHGPARPGCTSASRVGNGRPDAPRRPRTALQNCALHLDEAQEQHPEHMAKRHCAPSRPR
eukprot:scaffold5143_cov231-Pinguiococcus_pyrenoidosus.AAC.5